jgi:hypothetical protein
MVRNLLITKSDIMFLMFLINFANEFYLLYSPNQPNLLRLKEINYLKFIPD